MGVELGVFVISYLEEIFEEGIVVMVSFGLVGVVFFIIVYILRLRFLLVRRMLEVGVVVVLGLDFNFNVYCMVMVRNIGVRVGEGCLLCRVCCIVVKID